MSKIFAGIESADIEAVEDSSSCEVEALFPMFTFGVGVAMKDLGEGRGEIFQIAVFFTICPYFVGIT